MKKRKLNNFTVFCKVSVQNFTLNWNGQKSCKEYEGGKFPIVNYIEHCPSG